MRNALFIWLSCIFFLNGCVANYPKDIAVVSIKVVDGREQSELPAPPAPGVFRSNDPYRDFLFSLSEDKGKKVISPSDISVYFQRQSSNESFKNAKPQKPVLKLEFTSKENLHEFARKDGYSVAIWPYFCNRSGELMPRHGRVYWNGLDVGAPLNYEMWKDGDGLFVYYTFLDVAFVAKQPSSYESFDLRADPEDICFRVGGGFAGRGFKSNVVMIPRTDIIESLKKMPPELQQSAVR